jgi:hypothetical protein
MLVTMAGRAKRIQAFQVLEKIISKRGIEVEKKKQNGRAELGRRLDLRGREGGHEFRVEYSGASHCCHEVWPAGSAATTTTTTTTTTTGGACQPSRGPALE